MPGWALQNTPNPRTGCAPAFGVRDQGDPIAAREVRREGRYLGIGVANLITLYAPDIVVLGGSVMGSADLFLPSIRDVVRGSCGLVPADRVELAVAALGRDAPLIGAALVWRYRFGKEGE